MHEPDRLRAMPFSSDDFAVARALPWSSPLEGVAAEGDWRAIVTGNHGPLAVSAAFISGDFFPLLRTRPARGRLLSPSDDRASGPAVAVVTDYYWRTQLDARDDAIGRPILIGGRPVTVVGVAPPQFHGLRFLDVTLDDSNGTQIWMPLSQSDVWPSVPPRTQPWLNIVGRLKPSREIADAERDLSVTAARIAAADPDRRANAAIVVRPTGVSPYDSTVDLAVIIAAMLALPLTILAIGCANVANLQLARVTEQSRELALRLALGATRGQLLRLLTFETLGRVLAAAAISMAIVAAILARVQPLFPVFLAIDWRAASLAISLAVAVAFATGLVPAWLVLRRTAAGQLKETAQTGSLKHSRLRSSLVVVQVALSLTLFVLAGLFARTVQVMASAAPIALTEQLVMSFDPSTLNMAPAEFSAFAQTLAARTALDARVRSVALSVDQVVSWGIGGEQPARMTSMTAITPDWIEIMGARLVSGRALTPADDNSSVLVNERAANMISPDGHAVGSVVSFASDSSTPRQARIVGVVANIRRFPTDDQPDPAFYSIFPREISAPFTIRVRAGDPENLRPDLMRTVSSIDPRIAWTSISRGDRLFESETGEMSYVVYAVGISGIVALLLSATGLYAVMSYVVTLRRREIGVRLAIGAAPSRDVSLIHRQSMTLVVAGIVAGLLLAVPTAFAMRAAFVSRVSTVDPLVLGPTALLLLAVGVVASAIPALRASRVDPISTLRQD
jgi:predicted permease